MKINEDCLIGDTGVTLKSLTTPVSQFSFTTLYDGTITSGTTNINGNLSDYKALLFIITNSDNYYLPDTFIYAPMGKNVQVNSMNSQYNKFMRFQILKPSNSQFQIKVNSNYEYNTESKKETSGNYIQIRKIYGVNW